MVIKVLMDSNDWAGEVLCIKLSRFCLTFKLQIRGYHNSKKNPAVVQLIALMLISSTEVNELCQGIKGYVPREVTLMR